MSYASHRENILLNSVSEGRREREFVCLFFLSVCPCSKFGLQGVNQIRSYSSSHSLPGYITFWQHLSRSDPILCVVLPWDVWKFWEEPEIPDMMGVGLGRHISCTISASVGQGRGRRKVSDQECGRQNWQKNYEEVQKIYSIQGNFAEI